MKTIIITSQKGGSGKTTLATHLAVEAERKGDAPAWLIDTDKQGTLSLWHERREAETPQRADVPFSRLEAGLKTLADRGAAYCFIDTAPTISEQSASLLHLADLVLIPVRPSPADLWAVSETVTLVKDAGKPFLPVRHHPGQAASQHHRADHRRPVRAWPRRASLHRGPGALRRRDDRRPHRAGAVRQEPGRRGNRGPVA